jgi:hypothetical protein
LGMSVAEAGSAGAIGSDIVDGEGAWDAPSLDGAATLSGAAEAGAGVGTSIRQEAGTIQRFSATPEGENSGVMEIPGNADSIEHEDGEAGPRVDPEADTTRAAMVWPAPVAAGSVDTADPPARYAGIQHSDSDEDIFAVPGMTVTANALDEQLSAHFDIRTAYAPVRRPWMPRYDAGDQ